MDKRYLFEGRCPVCENVCCGDDKCYECVYYHYACLTYLYGGNVADNLFSEARRIYMARYDSAAQSLRSASTHDGTIAGEQKQPVAIPDKKPIPDRRTRCDRCENIEESSHVCTPAYVDAHTLIASLRVK